MANAEIGKTGWVTDYDAITRAADKESFETVKDAFRTQGVLGGIAAEIQRPHDHAINSYDVHTAPDGHTEVTKRDFAEGPSDTARDFGAKALQMGQNLENRLTGRPTREAPERPGIRIGMGEKRASNSYGGSEAASTTDSEPIKIFPEARDNLLPFMHHKETPALEAGPGDEAKAG